MGRKKWIRTAPEALKVKPKGIYWVEQEGEFFYWWTLDPMGRPCKCRGRYLKAYRAAMAAENFGYVKGEKPNGGGDASGA